jgi:hypothetical protein
MSQDSYMVWLLKWYYLVTSVGVIVHELAHYYAVVSEGLDVFEVDFFSLEGTSLGYVKHESPRTYTEVFVISSAPFFLNTVLCVLCFGIVGFVSVYMSNIFVISVVGVVGVWLGFSCGVHAFPSGADLENIQRAKVLLWEAREPFTVDKSQEIIRNRISFDISTWSIRTPIDKLVGVFYIGVLVVSRIYHIVVYVVLHPVSVITVPFVVFLYGAWKLRRFGSQFIYTGGLGVGVYVVVLYVV